MGLQIQEISIHVILLWACMKRHIVISDQTLKLNQRPTSIQYSINVGRMLTQQGSKIVLVRSYLRVSQAAGQVIILIFLLKIIFSPCMPINFVMQGKCLFSDILRPAQLTSDVGI